jgi:hypothetical protein
VIDSAVYSLLLSALYSAYDVSWLWCILLCHDHCVRARGISFTRTCVRGAHVMAMMFGCACTSGRARVFVSMRACMNACMRVRVHACVR